MRILMPIFSPPTGTYGGLTRVIAIARAATAAGHEVAFCAAADQADTLRQHGYRVYPMPAPRAFGLPGMAGRALNIFMNRRAQQVTLPVPPGRAVGDIWFVLALTGYASTGFLRECAAAQLAVVDDFQPDALFTDLDPAAFFTAHVTGLPIAYPFQGIVDYHWFPLPYQLLSRALRALLAEYGQPAMTPEELFLGPQTLKLIPSIPELDGTPTDRPDVAYVGSLLGDIQPGAGFTPEPGLRYVFAYVGTGSISLKALQRVLPQVFPDGGGVSCLVGAQSIERPYRIGSVAFMPYVPAADVLPHCDWTISHGGQNTIAQSLAHGVPLLLFPGPLFERRFNAEQVQAAGAGLMGEVNEFTPDWFADAFGRQAEYAAHARELGDRIRSYGGPAAAVSALEAWVEEGNVRDKRENTIPVT